MPIIRLQGGIAMANQIVWCDIPVLDLDRAIRSVVLGRAQWHKTGISRNESKERLCESYTMIKTIARPCLPFVSFSLRWAVSDAAGRRGTTRQEKSAPAKKGPATWLLAGREGECGPLSLLEKKGTEFRGIDSPELLAKKMRAAGHKVEIKEPSLASRPAVEAPSSRARTLRDVR